jgi:hypothetical protein
MEFVCVAKSIRGFEQESCNTNESDIINDPMFKQTNKR